ncbi:desumoylating isopeptidase 1 [Pancytospora epiphaga]|nr:desumoylating isopeptidase 1 [Pancytospora epiphaga]
MKYCDRTKFVILVVQQINTPIMDKETNNNEEQEYGEAGYSPEGLLKNGSIPNAEPCNVAKDEKIIEEVIAGTTKLATNKGETIEIKNEEVFLRVYDLSKGAAKVLSKQLLGFEIDGIWHTSIEIYGNEYYFQNGLMIQTVGTTPYGSFVERISLGHTNCSRASLEEYFELSRNHWTPESYDLFENNCNNFSNYLTDFLLQRSIPSYILELPKKVKESPAFKQLFGMRMNK